jgi:hypothetical protein
LVSTVTAKYKLKARRNETGLFITSTLTMLSDDVAFKL